MVLDIFETQENDPDEPAEDNEVRLALGLTINDQGQIDPEDAPWKIDFNGEDGRLEIIDEENETVAYVGQNEDGDMLATGDGGGVWDDDGSGTATFTEAVADMDGADITNLDTFDYDVAVDSLGTADNSSASVDIDVSQQSVWELDVTADIEIGFIGADTDGVYSATVFVDHSGTETITFATDVEFDQNGEPDFQEEGEVAITVYTRDGGTTWKASYGEWLV